MNTQRLQLVNLAFGIAPAPGQHHVWLERHDAFQVHSLPAGNLFDRFGLRRIIGIAADADRRDPGGKGQFGIGGGEGDHPRRGQQPRRGE